MTIGHPGLLALLLLLPAIAALWRWRRGRVGIAALGLRMLNVALLVLALGDIRLGSGAAPPGAIVILLDQSDSLGAGGRAALAAEAARLEASVSGPVHVIPFAATPLGRADRPEQLDPSATSIAAALRAAHGLLAVGGGRVVLLSDGVQTHGDALAEARALAAAGLQVDVVPFTPAIEQDARITALDVPRTLRTGEEYTLVVEVASDAPLAGGLRLYESNVLVEEQQVELDAGINRFTTLRVAGAAGVIQLRAEIEVAPDRFARNNMLGATAVVAPPPRVLLVEGRTGTAAYVREALARAGVQSDVIAPSLVPVRLSDLAPYEGLVLVDVPASVLTLDQMATVRELVRSEGKGLVVLGGRNSFGLGAYQETPLEQVLPVRMEPPPRKERPDVALLIIIDRSASMEEGVGGASRFDMARQAAILAVGSLRAEDRIGILSFDTSTSWVVPFQTVGAGLTQGQVQDAIATIPIGGGTDIFAALNAGLPALRDQLSTVRHALLLTDGRSFNTDREPFRMLITGLAEQDISLSTIAIGQDSDTALLSDLATWGNGRYYFAPTPEDIPRLTLTESEIARTDPVIEGELQPALADARGHPLVRGFVPASIPWVSGYVGTTIRPEAELVLESPEGDPLLAVWQYGLGRAVAWTSQVEAPWARAWTGWPDYGRFWAQVVRYTLPEPGSGLLQVRVEPADVGVRLVAESLTAGGAPLDLASTTVRLTLPDGTERDVELGQVAPGRYVQVLVLPADGPYAIAVRQVAQGVDRAVLAGYTQRYPAEYAFAPPGGSLLEDVARLTGGTVLVPGDGAPSVPAGVPASGVTLWPWLASAALAVWVLEIAVRRRVVQLR